jgi:CBS domain-containing protein
MRRARPAAEVTASAREVMRSPALTVPPDLALTAAAQRMIEGKRKVAVVVDDDGRLLGALDRAELLLQLVASGKAEGAER